MYCIVSQDQERLRKLKMEHEFQRRVREIAEKGDYEYDDDDELAERLFVSSQFIVHVYLGGDSLKLSSNPTSHISLIEVLQS